jgi:hypothetical protein
VAWQRCALLWQSQLSFAGWTSVVDTLRVDRARHDRDRDVVVGLSDGNLGVPLIDVDWLLGVRRSGLAGYKAGDNFGSLSRQAYFSCTEYGDIVNHVLAPFNKYLPNAAWDFLQGESGQWRSGARMLLDVLFGHSTDERYRRDLLNYYLPQEPEEDHIFERLFLDAVLMQFDRFDLTDFEDSSYELTHNPQFWTTLCDRIGKGGDDERLLSLLCRSWNTGTAFRGIPESVLDAWLRMTERGVVIQPPAPSLLTVLDGLDLEKLGRTRPDLIKRTRVAMAEIGQADTITWPR